MVLHFPYSRPPHRERSQHDDWIMVLVQTCGLSSSLCLVHVDGRANLMKKGQQIWEMETPREMKLHSQNRASHLRHNWESKPNLPSPSLIATAKSSFALTACHPSFTLSESTMVRKPLAVQSEVHRRGQVVRQILRLSQPSLLFYTGSNQAVLKGNFWISLFVQCLWMRHLVHVLLNLKADLSHRS